MRLHNYTYLMVSEHLVLLLLWYFQHFTSPLLRNENNKYMRLKGFEPPISINSGKTTVLPLSYHRFCQKPVSLLFEKKKVCCDR